jgi:hypothetical protein
MLRLIHNTSILHRARPFSQRAGLKSINRKGAKMKTLEDAKKKFLCALCVPPLRPLRLMLFFS